MFMSVIGRMCVCARELDTTMKMKVPHLYHTERDALNDTDHQQSWHLLTVVVLWETYLAKVFFSHAQVIILYAQDNYKIQDIYLKRVYLTESNANSSLPYYGEYSANQVLF